MGNRGFIYKREMKKPINKILTSNEGKTEMVGKVKW